jgi:hypothetical protein
MKLLTQILVMAVVLGSANAGAETDIGNAGNADALEFTQDAHGAIAAVQADPVDYPQVQGLDLENILDGAQVLFSENPLSVTLDGVQQDAVAENFAPNLITVNQQSWEAIQDPAIKKALALHEVLGLAGIEATGQYPVSQKYLSGLGVQCSQDLCAPPQIEGDPLLNQNSQNVFQGSPSLQGSQDSLGDNPYGLAMGGYSPNEIWSATPYIAGSVDSSAATFDLTEEGATDWIQWNYTTSRKSISAPVLPDYSYMQPYQKVNAYGTDSRPLSWSDGFPTAQASNDRSGFSVANGGNGFSFTAPSDRNVRTLVVHVSQYFSSARLIAELGDGSAAVFQSDMPAVTATNGADRNYTITYSSKNPTKLKVSLYVTSFTGNANLSAAALSLTGQTSDTSGISGTWRDSADPADLTQEGSSDWVHWGEATANRKLNGGNQISDFSTPAVYEENRVMRWSDGADSAPTGLTWMGTCLAQQNNGFAFEIPVGNLRQRLTLHVGGDLGGAVLTAVLNDGSGYTYTDVVAPTSKFYYRNYTLDFNASQPSTLTLTWKMNSPLGTVTLTGMALQ